MVNLDNVSFIEDSAGKKAVILSISKYDEMICKIEELEDIESFLAVKRREEESFPIKVAEKLLLGDEVKIKVIREYRGYKLNELAKKVGVTEAYLSQIENGKRKGTVETYKKIADELSVDMDMLV